MDYLILAAVLSQVAETILRIVDVTQGRTVSPADIDAARKRTDEAMARLEAAVKERTNG